MHYTDSDGRAQPVRPVWMLDNRNRKPGQHRCDLCRACANDDHHRSASSIFCGRNDTPNEWFALKNRELLWLSEADRTTGGENDRGHTHWTTMLPLRWRWLPWYEYWRHVLAENRRHDRTIQPQLRLQSRALFPQVPPYRCPVLPARTNCRAQH